MGIGLIVVSKLSKHEAAFGNIWKLPDTQKVNDASLLMGRNKNKQAPLWFRLGLQIWFVRKNEQEAK